MTPNREGPESGRSSGGDSMRETTLISYPKRATRGMRTYRRTTTAQSTYVRCRHKG